MENIELATRERAVKAASFYTAPLLFFYDYYVFKFASRLVFHCPERKVIDFYLERITSNHLEVGVGTGYLLNKCAEQGKIASLSLLDFNKNCLDVTEKALATYMPDKHHANILEPLPIHNRKYDSVGINFVLHCVPGSFREKGVALDHIAEHLNKGSTLFGSTIIYYPGQSKLSKFVMNIYNRKGIFNNTRDTREELAEALARNYSNIEISQTGNVLFFTATKA